MLVFRRELRTFSYRSGFSVARPTVSPKTGPTARRAARAIRSSPPEPVAGSIVRAGDNDRAEYHRTVVSMAVNYARAPAKRLRAPSGIFDFGAGNLASSGKRSRDGPEDSILPSNGKKSIPVLARACNDAVREKLLVSVFR